jgi:ISXO2 transposase-like protein
MFNGINAIEFNKRFKNNEDCFLYLMELKWGKGYTCVKCKGAQWGKGRLYYYKRCKNCGYDESVLANTVFHDMRLPLLKAFHLAFRITAKKKGMSSIELAGEVGVQQKTAWLFKRKMQAVMEKEDKKKLQGEVIIDESLVGGGKAGSYGRTHEEKEIMFIAVEKLPGERTGNIALQPIDDFKLPSMLGAVEKNIDPKATVYADDFPTNRGIKKRRINTELIRSKGGEFFEELHKQVMMFKMWLSGIHHQCSTHHFKGYTAEYVFRFNRRNQRQWIFHNLLIDAIAENPKPYEQLKPLAN